MESICLQEQNEEEQLLCLLPAKFPKGWILIHSDNTDFCWGSVLFLEFSGQSGLFLCTAWYTETSLYTATWRDLLTWICVCGLPVYRFSSADLPQIARVVPTSTGKAPAPRAQSSPSLVLASEKQAAQDPMWQTSNVITGLHKTCPLA